MRGDKKLLRQRFLDVAGQQVGYTAPGTTNHYTALVGRNGNPWAGAFIDVVAHEAGIQLPACTNTLSGLAEFTRTGRVHQRPQPGDIVFLTFPSDPNAAFSSGHAGIVTGVDGWARSGRVETIEGQAASGKPRGHGLVDGVYQRARYRADILCFGRPTFEPRPGLDPGGLTGKPEISLARIKPNRPSRDIEILQRALATRIGLKDYRPGVLDEPTRSSYSAWQRSIGWVGKEVTGLPTQQCLELLALETRSFIVTKQL